MKRKLKSIQATLYHYKYALLSGGLFAILFLFALAQLLHQARTISDQLIVEDVQRLSQIFKTIDENCKIISFEHQKNYIDFLNVEKFVGSEVGAMNLMAPEKWKGPYLKDNPMVQDKLYQVVRTRNGYFVTPGDGVRLANGKVIGKDIVLDEHANIEALINDPQGLQYKGKSLAASIHIGGIGFGASEIDLVDEYE